MFSPARDCEWLLTDLFSHLHLSHRIEFRLTMCCSELMLIDISPLATYQPPTRSPIPISSNQNHQRHGVLPNATYVRCTICNTVEQNSPITAAYESGAALARHQQGAFANLAMARSEYQESGSNGCRRKFAGAGVSWMALPVSAINATSGDGEERTGMGNLNTSLIAEGSARRSVKVGVNDGVSAGSRSTRNTRNR